MKSTKEKLTGGRVAKFACEVGKEQSFLWDASCPGLAVRATRAGSKAYVFQSRLKSGEVLRMTIGDCRAWVLDEQRDQRGELILPGARQEAARLQSMIDQGSDPRQARADKIAGDQARRQAAEEVERAAEETERRGQVTMGEAWKQYIDARRSKWSSRHLFDHEKLILPTRTKNQKVLVAAVLAELVPLPLSALTSKRIGEWLEDETPKRGTQASLAFRLLRAFLNWCGEQDQFKGIAADDACSRRVSREHLLKANAKTDALQREQLRLWFEAVGRIKNPSISTYLQGLLLTGARREELAGLRWTDVDFQWNSMIIGDKVDGKRTIPLTPYFAHLLRQLKARNEIPPTVRRLKTLEKRGETWSPSAWVFSSQTSTTGRLEEPSIAHRKALTAVGLPQISLHGLRRSFGSLAEWCECPIGVVAQIMGHKPSATAEKHYRVRPLDLLRMWHTRIEAWMLEQAGIEQPKRENGPALKVVGHD